MENRSEALSTEANACTSQKAKKLPIYLLRKIPTNFAFSPSSACILLKSYFRMDKRDLDGDTSFLADLLTQDNPSVEFIEQDLRVTLNAIHRQVDICLTLRIQWRHIREDNSFVL
ncbi:hypothetical protein RB195_006135 [Necator americanus]|uniref:Uncharacterized protein n=1 Tax=Necator americanus TaxID=51031 RepID=A0ABR1BU47_NECAM